MTFDRRITAVDIHADGMPGRVITGGVSDVPGATMLDKARYLETHADDLRKIMLNEPRGYPASCCNLVLPSSNPAADYGYVIMEHVEYPAMSGSNTICTVTSLLETGRIPMVEPVTTVTDGPGTKDITHLTLSATPTVAEGGKITYTATLTNKAGTEAENGLKYITPNFGGFEAALSYSFGENKTATTKADSTLALGVKYKTGPFAVALGHFQHKDAVAAAGAWGPVTVFVFMMLVIF